MTTWSPPSFPPMLDRRQPCECGMYVDDLPFDVTHCMIHHANEPVGPDIYRVCGECLHAWTGPALMAAHIQVVEVVRASLATWSGHDTSGVTIGPVEEVETSSWANDDTSGVPIGPVELDYPPYPPTSPDDVWHCPLCVHDF